jgi:phosphoglycolate phosphatase
MRSSFPYDLVVFDLDGTLSDPIDGITRSLNHALTAHGYAARPEADLARHIGPPLDHAFAALVPGASAEEIASLVGRYRERYAEVGYAENRIYPEIPEVLARLAAARIPMGVCTVKRVDFAHMILDLFEISGYFRFVDGGDVGREKWQQLAALRVAGRISAASVMVGDRAGDLVGAHRNGLASLGALWGYGTREELAAEEPRALLERPTSLLEHLRLA